ncbi:hypothetical protein X949_5831 [Burkholderia pseudomallei MSHR5609]|nr:hypothetical protein DM75_1637 [Burkholderia mallei]KGD40154.1 hypothetical protein DP44_2802 [Burkholderia pseudomallei]KGS17633.1 hypothetical protein X989_5215 [Burkholderia pseudomallei MSHR4378]KGS20950.1 hypothetical protein X962_5561 [Burkholderia pseudomallei MSHR7343]KGS26768.1 hypothetical protein X941_4236 [Burkholderia pseudomallei MSHR5569]KGS53214.1 hypothetical protein X949_5831 [Burkholderia pseudomallei MSHR5609]KGW96894.1 hypothetical protein Y048_5674 [Burkholderia pseud
MRSVKRSCAAGEKYPLNLIWIMPAQGSVRVSPLFHVRIPSRRESRLLLSALPPLCMGPGRAP